MSDVQANQERERKEREAKAERERGRESDSGRKPPGESSRYDKFISKEAVEEMNDDSEATLELRLERLREYLRQRRGAVRVTNASLETGRPPLQLTADMRPDPTNPYNRPSIEALCRIKPRAISNNMATSEDMMKIVANIEGLGVPTEQVQNVIIQAVVYCKDASSSAFLDPRGSFEWGQGQAISADSIIAILKRDAEFLRRVCRLYAPVTWNYMLAHNAPPADWAAMGFQFEDRFAAFDCFDYVENSAAVQPLEGLIRRPTPREKIAHAAHKDIALRRANRNQIFGNMDVELTGGKSGPEIVRDYSKSSN